MFYISCYDENEWGVIHNDTRVVGLDNKPLRFCSRDAAVSFCDGMNEIMITKAWGRVRQEVAPPQMMSEAVHERLRAQAMADTKTLICYANDYAGLQLKAADLIAIHSYFYNQNKESAGLA